MGVKKIVPIEQLIEDYVNTAGASIRSLCRKYGLCHTTVKRRLTEAGIAIIPDRQWGHREASHPALRDKEWLQEQIQQKSIPTLARELNISAKTIHDQIRRHQLTYPESIWKKLGAGAPNWRGGRVITGGGHVYIHQPDHIAATKEGYVMEHRLVMEQSIGRMLTADEVVHHKNGIKTDNRIENLELMTKNEHRRHHLQASAKVHDLEQENARLKARLVELEHDHRP